MGVPLLNGFVGELLILLGVFEHHPMIAFFATGGVLFGAIYILYLLREILFGESRSAENLVMKDLSTREWVVLLPICLAILYLGVHPAPVLELIEPSALQTMQHLQQVQPMHSLQQSATKSRETNSTGYPSNCRKTKTGFCSASLTSLLLTNFQPNEGVRVSRWQGDRGSLETFTPRARDVSRMQGVFKRACRIQFLSFYNSMDSQSYSFRSLGVGIQNAEVKLEAGILDVNAKLGAGLQKEEVESAL